MDERELTEAGVMAEDMFVRQMKRRRAALNLSQAELASRISDLGGSLYQQTIAKIEAGQRAVRLQEADLIAKALRSTVSEMLAQSIGVPEERQSEMPIEDLIERVRAVQRSREEATRRVQEAREEAAEAHHARQIAEQRATTAEARAASAASYLDALDRELKGLTRTSLLRQSELNAKYGPRWREKMRIHEPITREWLQSQNRQRLDEMRDLLESPKSAGDVDREALLKAIRTLEAHFEQQGDGE